MIINKLTFYTNDWLLTITGMFHIRSEKDLIQNVGKYLTLCVDKNVLQERLGRVHLASSFFQVNVPTENTTPISNGKY